MNQTRNETPASFKSKKVRYGAYSTVTILFVLAILIIFNLVMESLNVRFDLTPDNFYTVSESSYSALSDLKDPITIYTLFKTGEEIYIYDELIKDYENVSSYITVENRDPYLYPQFVEGYVADGEEIPVNSIIIQGPFNHRVLTPQELLTYGYDYYNMQTYVESIDLEPLVTNAILYVTQEETQKIYFVTGHNEIPLSAAYIQLIHQANYGFEELNMFDIDRVPEDTDILFISTPARDWTVTEIEKLKQYLDDGGNALFFIDYITYEIENLKSVLNYYGVDISQNLVLETNPENLIALQGAQYIPYMLMPTVYNHDITSETLDRGYRLFMPYAAPLSMLDVRRSTIEIDRLLSSSPSSYAKGENSAITTINKEAGDIDGPFDLGYAITEYFQTATGGSNTKLVLLGSSSLLDDQYNTGYNSDFVLNCLNWLSGNDSSVYIKGKNVAMENLQFNSYTDFVKLFTVSFLLLPGVILITGIVVWLRRRNK